MIECRNVTSDDLTQLVDLVLSRYQEERSHISMLPHPDEMKSLFEQSISWLIEKGSGLVATEQNEIVGFMIGIMTGPLFGNNNGIFVPTHGHASVFGREREIYLKMYIENARNWTFQGFVSHAVGLYAHNENLERFWFENGFGMRCVDAIRQTKSESSAQSEIFIQKATASDLPSIASIHGEHNMYYKESPIFMPRNEEDSLADLQEWFTKDDHHLWFAKKEDEVIGYMRIQPTAESVVSFHKSVMNITGAYVRKSDRDLHVGSLLLNTILNWLNQNEIPLCGVDYESINPSGSNFWGKHFSIYSVSLTRRIDERILF